MPKKLLLIAGIIVSVIVGGLLGLKYFKSQPGPLSQPETEKVKPVGYAAQAYAVESLFGTKASPTALTTSYVSTTLDIESFKTMDLDLYFTPNSSTSQLDWKYEFSGNGTDFFQEDGYSVGTNAVTHNALGINHLWTPATTTLILKNVTITNVNAKFLRVWFRGVTATGTLWVRATARQDQ